MMIPTLIFQHPCFCTLVVVATGSSAGFPLLLAQYEAMTMQLQIASH